MIAHSLNELIALHNDCRTSWIHYFMWLRSSVLKAAKNEMKSNLGKIQFLERFRQRNLAVWYLLCLLVIDYLDEIPFGA